MGNACSGPGPVAPADGGVAALPPPSDDPAPAPAPAADGGGDDAKVEEGDGDGGEDEEEEEEDSFSDEEETFGKVESDNEGDVDDEEPLTFGVTDVEGENFMSVKPWIGAMKEPTDWSAPDDLGTMPDKQLQLTRVQGYRCRGVYSNVHFASTGEMVYPAAAVVVMYNKETNTQRFYQRHVDDVLCVALSADGTLAASGGKATVSDKGRGVHPSLHIWNVETGENIAISRNRHKRAIVCVCWSPDGKYVVSVGLDNDHTMLLHDASTGNVVAATKTGTDKVIGVTWNAETNTICTVGVKHICFWAFTGSGFGRRKRGLVGRRGKRQSHLSCTTVGGRCWTGTYSGHVYVWDGNKLVKNLKGHSKRVNALYAGPEFVLSGDNGGEIRAWSPSGDCLGSYNVGEPIRALCVAAAGRVAVGTARGKVLQLVVNTGDMESTTSETIFAGHWAGETWGMAVSPEGNQAVTTGDDNLICLWDLESHARIASRIIEEKAEDNGERRGRQSTMSSCAPNQCARTADWGPMGTIAVGTNDGKVRILNAEDLTTVVETKVTNRPISVVKFDPTGDYLAIGAHDSQAYIYKTEDLSRVSRCTGNSSWISHIDWDSTGIAIQTNSGAYELLFYTAETGEQDTNGATLYRDEPWASFTCTLGWPVKGIWPAFSKGSDINTVDRDVDSTLLAVGDDRGRIRLFRWPCIDRGSAHRTDRGHASHLTCLKFSMDTSRLLSVGGNDNTLLVWNVADAE